MAQKCVPESWPFEITKSVLRLEGEMPISVREIDAALEGEGAERIVRTRGVTGRKWKWKFSRAVNALPLLRKGSNDRIIEDHVPKVSK